jgi:hypothetical protein
MAVVFGVAGGTQAAVRLTWSPPQHVRHHGLGNLVSASCPTARFCIGYDGIGDVVTSTDPSRGASSWSYAVADRRAGLVGMTCRSRSMCVGYDTAGNIVDATRPTGGSSAWRLIHVDTGKGLTGLSCPSVSLCVAVDQAGNAITTTNPAGGPDAWTAVYLSDTSPTYECIHYGGLGGGCGQASLSDLSCPSAHLCFALDQAGNVIASTNPTGGAAGWSVVFAESSDSSSGLSQLACVSASFCYGNDRWGDFVASADPARSGSWTATGVGPGDRPGWSYPDPGFAGIVSGVSCPSSSLCVGRNGNGQLLATRDPTASAPVWRVVLDRGRISGVCASLAWCFAWDTRGNLFSSENPAAGADAWTRARSRRTSSPTTFSCPSASLCLEFDTNGTLRVGQPAPTRAKIRAAGPGASFGRWPRHGRGAAQPTRL